MVAVLLSTLTATTTQEAQRQSYFEKGCTCTCVCSFGNGLSGWCSSHKVVSQSRETSGHRNTTFTLHLNLKQLKSPHAASMNALNGGHHHISLGLGCFPKNGLTSSSPILLLTQNSNHVHKNHDQSVCGQHLSMETPTWW